ncbi:MAG TPA: hypothetical protein VN200_01000 [Rhodoglobus sp.]|nr:hypothetical protein [Rhodoglobus sp.]
MLHRVALVTCAELPDLDDDDRLLRAELEARGVEVAPAVWDDPAVEWDGFDLAVLRSPWDYASRRDEFVAWARAVPRLLNGAEVVAWNTHKGYLRDLAAAGVPVVETDWYEPGERFTPRDGAYVVKPAVSAGSKDTGLYRPGDEALAAGLAARILASGRTVMVQPYLESVATAGETALLFFGDGRGSPAFSHAARKGPMLTGPDRGGDELFVAEVITARQPGADELAVAEAALAAAPDGLLYARVDLIRGDDGSPVIVELELTEPSCFLSTSEGAAGRFADAISARLR